MDEELERQIEKKKQMIEDYLRLASHLNFGKEAFEKRLDALLEDLSKLMKQRK